MGQFCNDGVCTPGGEACSPQNPCPAGQQCRNGTCVGEPADGGDGDGGDGSDGGDTEPEPDIEIVNPLPSQGVYELNFGNVQVGQAVEQSIIVRNAGEAELRLLELSFEAGEGCGDFSLHQDTLDSVPIALQAGEEAEVPVVYLATDGVTDTCILDIVSNDPDEALVKIHLISEFKGEAKIAVDKTALDFGDVEVGKTSQPLSVTVTNQGTGNAVLTIEDIRLGTAGSEDFSLEVKDFSGQPVQLPALINRSDGVDVFVTYHPQQQEQDSEKIIIVSDDGVSPTLEVSLAGRGVVGDVAVTPSPIDLGKVRVGDSTTQTVTITNSGGAPLQITGITLSAGAEFGMNSTDIDIPNLASNPHQLDAGASATLDISFNPQDVGQESGELVITHTGPSAERRVNVTATGYIPAHITFNPDPPSLDFGQVQYDAATSQAETASLTITIGNSGGEDLVVSDMVLESDSQEFSWQPQLSVIPTGSSVDLQVSFTPSSGGDYSDRIILTTNDPDTSYGGVAGQAAIELKARAIDPVMVVTPNGPQDFGQVTIGSESRRSITIISASNDPLQVTGIGLSGGSSPDFVLENLPDISQPLTGVGSTYTFDVVYRPSDAGSDVAQLVITSNDLGNPSVTINLAGSSPGCPAGFGDCDNDPSTGCETALNTNSNCGGCNVSCVLDHAQTSCQTGSCQIVSCTGTWQDCNTNPLDGCEVNTASDVEHCGDCATACGFPNAGASCQNGSCVMGACNQDWWDLDGDPSNGCEYNCVYQSGTDRPDSGFVDANCDGIDGNISDAVFVSVSGNDAWPGTMAQPVATIGKGLQLAQNSGKSQVLVSTGNFYEAATIQLVDGISIYGGYDPSTWTRSSASLSRVQVASTTAVAANGVGSGTELQLMAFESAAATITGGSSYGMFATNSSFSAWRCEFRAGAGAAGQD
ncbi:MAG: choice-of-anchor D domain-containing protein, partial [Deltaproteobacteria bacterium]